MRETRILEAADLRVETGGDCPVVEGYAALYNVRSQNLGGFVEYIEPGAFKRALSESHDVRALIDHDSSKVLGRTRSGTLELTSDERGLRIRCPLPNTSYARDLAESMRRGDVSQMSFAFRPTGDSKFDGHEVVEGRKLAVHRVRDCDLLDVSIVTYPAYPQTEASVRSLAQFEEQEKALAQEEAAKAQVEEAEKAEVAIRYREASLRLAESKF